MGEENTSKPGVCAKTADTRARRAAETNEQRIVKDGRENDSDVERVYSILGYRKGVDQQNAKDEVDDER